MPRIELTKGLFAIVSDEDYIFASSFKWTASEQCRPGSGLYYAIRRTSRKLHPEGKQFKQWLHVEIMKRMLGVSKLPDGFVPDHGEGGTLDCRRENLQLIDGYQNKINALSKKYKQWASDGSCHTIFIPDHISL